MLTKAELRSTAWQRVFRGIYADAALPLSHRDRCVIAARYLLPGDAAIAGRAAAALHRGLPLGRADPIEVVVPTGSLVSRHRELIVHSGPLPEGDVTVVRGVRVTSPERTCADLARWCDLIEAVVIIDTLLASRAVTTAGLRSYALAHAGERGWRTLARAAALADAGAQSPQESRLRVRLVLAGLPRPVTQFVITRNGAFVARVDLAWPDAKVAIEYDGEWHAEQTQFHRDRRRLNKILGSDWIVLHVTARRMRDDLPGFLAEVRAALKTRTVDRARTA